MRVALFADSYKPYISGVTISIETLAKELRELGHRVYIFAPSYPNSDDSGQDIFRFPSFKTSYPGFRLAIPYLKEFPEFDIIHTHSPFQEGLLARYLARKRKIPIVYTFHTLFTRYAHYARFLPERFSKLVISSYIREFCKKTDLILAPSTMSKRVLRRWGIKTPCEVVPTGCPDIPKGMSREQTREKLNIPQNAKVLVYLGRISKEKNLPFLFSAFEKINGPNCYFLLIGGGPLLEDLKEGHSRESGNPPQAWMPHQVRHDSRIRFTGEISHSEAVNYLAAGDIFIFSSTTETQGLVLAEAKSMGLPIVALFAGGLVDTVRTGIDGYLTPRNIPDFVSHIERILKDDALRDKMGLSAKEDAAERFSSKKIAKHIESLYNSLITGGA